MSGPCRLRSAGRSVCLSGCPRGEQSEGLGGGRTRFGGEDRHAEPWLGSEVHGFVGELQVADDVVVLGAARVGADVVGTPAAAELIAAGGQLADQILECLVVRVLARRSTVGDRDVGGVVPVGVQPVSGAVEEREPCQVGWTVGRSAYTSAYSARPRWLAASRSDLLFPTIAGPVVIESSAHCRLGCAAHCAGPRRRDAWRPRCRRRPGRGGTGAGVRRHPVGGRGRSRRGRPPRRLQVRRARAWRSTRRSPRPERPPRCDVAWGHGAAQPEARGPARG